MSRNCATHTLGDGTTLAYAVYRPPEREQDPVSDELKLALVAHPWGRLGGTKNDHVVHTLAQLLSTEQGFTVVTFDSRGCGASDGTPSWTGSIEVDDFRHLLNSVVLGFLPPPPPPSSGSRLCAHETPPVPGPIPVRLLLCGYSFGSLVASACPPPAPTAHYRFDTSYVLVSYPLSVMFALTAFHSATFTRALLDRVVVDDDETVTVCCAYGDGDQFTAVSKLRAWSRRLEALAGARGGDRGRTGRVSVIEVKGADHFWAQTRSKNELFATLTKWLNETSNRV